MNKIAVILLLLLGVLFSPLFSDAKPPVSPKSCKDCTSVPGSIALRDALHQDKLAQIKIDRKIEHSDLVVSALLLSAEDALKKGDEAAAILMAQKAILFSEASPLPHFFLSHLYRLTGRESILRALGEYATAIRLSISNFWLFTTAIGIVAFIFMITFHLCLLTFLLYYFIYYTPIWVHYVKERLPVNIHNNAILFVIVFFIGAFFYLVPSFWAIFISLFLFWFFYQPQEKTLAIIFLVGMIFFSFLQKPIFSLLTAKQSHLLDQMVKNQEGDFLVSTPSFDKEHGDWMGLFIRASYETQEKHFAEAEVLYQQALLKNPNEKRILNNLGNIAFYRDHLREALLHYQKAIDKDPNYVVAHYNMGQVSNETLDFEKGQKKYIEAKKINQELTESYAQLVATYPNHPVIEERFTPWELRKQLFSFYWNNKEDENNIGRIWTGGLSSIALLILIFLIGGGLLFACFRLKKYVSGEFCPICHKAICLKCQESFTNYNLCTECGTDMVTGISKKQGEIPRRVLLFFIIPGGGQLVLQKPILALGLLMPFYFSVALMSIGDVFLTSEYWHLSIADSPLLPMTIFFIYSVYLLDIYLRKGR